MKRPELARRLVHSCHSALLRGVAPYLRPEGIEDRAFVLGTGRGGTTVFADLVCSGLAAQQIFEPLRPQSGRKVDALVPHHGYPEHGSTDIDKALSDYLTGVFHLRGLTRWSSSQTTIGRLRYSRAIVVKEVRANRIAGWLQHQFPTIPILVVVRHPFDVVESMARAARGWSEMPFEDLVPPAAQALGCSAGDLCSVRDDPNLWMFAVWLADTKRVVTDLQVDRTHILVHYEDLCSSPDGVARKCASAFEGFDSARAARSVDRASATASEEFMSGFERPLGAQLIHSTRRRISRLLADFEIDMYSTDERGPRRRMHR